MIRARQFRQNARLALQPGLGRAVALLVLMGLAQVMLKRIWHLSFAVPLSLEEFLQFAQAAARNQFSRLAALLQPLLNPTSGQLARLLWLAVGDLALHVFSAPLFRVGLKRWFSRQREIGEIAPWSLAFSLFRFEGYSKLISASLWRDMVLFLWRLPLLLLGFLQLLLNYQFFLQLLHPRSGVPWLQYVQLSVILVLLQLVAAIWLLRQQLSYALVDWLLADQPQFEARFVLELSRKMMKGYRWRLFCLRLSFLPWALLALFSLFLAPVFLLILSARLVASEAEFYAMRRDLAVAEGLITMTDLGYCRVE